MRVFTLTFATVAVSTLAFAPANACEFMKTVQNENMTVVQQLPETPELLVATNDLADAVVQEMSAEPAPKPRPAE